MTRKGSEVQSFVSAPMTPHLIYETKDFLILNKPAGLLVHSDEAHKEPSLVDWLLENYPEIKGVGDEPNFRPGLVHRLDKETSGILLVTKNQVSFDYYKNLFKEHHFTKIYLALTEGLPKDFSGFIDLPIGLKSGTVKRTIHTTHGNVKMVKSAKTKYNVLKTFQDKFALIEVIPETGRTHQIRVHLAAINCPIVGDSLYGKKKPSIKFPRQFLHASSLEFTDQAGSRLKFEAPLPEDLSGLLESLS